MDPIVCGFCGNDYAASGDGLACSWCGSALCPICNSDPRDEQCEHFVAMLPQGDPGGEIFAGGDLPLYDEEQGRSHEFGPIKQKTIQNAEAVFGESLPVVVLAYHGDLRGATDGESIFRAVIELRGEYLIECSCDGSRTSGSWLVVFAADRVQLLRDVKRAGALILAKSEVTKAYALAAVEDDPDRLETLPKKFRDDRDVVLLAVTSYGQAMEYASERLRDDPEIVLAALSHVYLAHQTFQFASERLRDDREIALVAVKRDRFAFEYASERLRDDDELVLAAAEYADQLGLQHVSERLRAKREIVTAAVKGRGRDLEFASEDLRADRRVVLSAVNDDGRALQFASAELRADREVVLAAFTGSRFYGANALEFASEELRADREVVLAAVSAGSALQFASEELRADRELVLTAVRCTGSALKYASDDLRADREIVLEAFSDYSGGYVLEFASEDLRADRDLMLLIEGIYSRRVHGYAWLQYAGEGLRADPDFMLPLIEKDRAALKFASEEIQNSFK